jgi:tRNA wybutosine-synthesizing protein 5
MQIMDRALKALEELPDSYKDFYGRRLIAKIEKRFKNIYAISAAYHHH